MEAKKIVYSKPSITGLEINYASDAAKNGWGDDCYKYINKFEDIMLKHLGVKLMRLQLQAALEQFILVFQHLALVLVMRLLLPI